MQCLQRSRTRLIVEAIHQDQVEFFAIVVQHVFRAVANDQTDALRVFRQLEKLPCGGDHGGLDLYHGEMHKRIMAIQKFDQRSRAETDQQHFPWWVAQQQTRQHFARIFQLKIPWPRNAHRALYPLRAEVQSAHAGFFTDVDGYGHISAIFPMVSSGRRPDCCCRFFIIADVSCANSTSCLRGRRRSDVTDRHCMADGRIRPCSTNAHKSCSRLWWNATSATASRLVRAPCSSIPAWRSARQRFAT